MRKRIPVPTFSEFLLEEFMIPLQLDAQTLSLGVHIPLSEVQAILRDETEITLDESAQLGAFFGVSDSVFYDMQEVLKKRASRNNRSKGHEEIKERELALA